MIKLFNNIEEKQQEKILKTLEAERISFKKNSQILSSIKWNNMIGVIKKGNIKICKTDYKQNETIIESLEENSVFGISISIVNNDFKIIAEEDTEIIIIDNNNITKIVDFNQTHFKEFIKNYLAILTQKININNERIEILIKKSIRDKLLEYFKTNFKKTGSKIINLKMSYTELANYLAIDRCAMSRELHNLIKEGFIKKNGKKITLLY